MDCDITGYHVESFNFFCNDGLRMALDDVPTEKFRLKNGDAVEICYKGGLIRKPNLQSAMAKNVEDITNVQVVYPSECRQRGLTYRGPLFVDIEVKVNGNVMGVFSTLLGHIPIMLRSSLCHLNGMSEEELVEAGEESLERGGYFINKGSEKVIRLLIGNKRNFPMALVRGSFKEKGKMFTEFGVLMRCLREGHSAAIMTLHYLDSASMVLTIQYRRELFYIPLMYVLKALTDMSDIQIFENMTKLRPKDTYWASCVKNMLVSAAEEGVTDRPTALRLLGSRFRVAISQKVAPWETDKEAGSFILRYCVAVHLDSDEDKFHCLSFMGQKLISLALGQILPESPDNPQFQEATVTGHIFLLIMRERLEASLSVLKKKIEIIEARRKDKFVFDGKFIQTQLPNIGSSQITRTFEYFLATGNLSTNTGAGLMQEQGFAVIAERINQLRFISHFRAIHRGAFFMETRTTDVRKLRPEAWGFICPVHTPDGAPCGLLNHLTASCEIVTQPIDIKPVISLLLKMGVITHEEMRLHVSRSKENPEEFQLFYPVFVDGRVVGYVARSEAARLERQLRAIKVNPKDNRVSSLIEIVLVKASTDETNILTQFPGFYIFSDMGRMYRPVKNLLCKKTEYVGIFEQVYLSIIVDPGELEHGVTYHQELHPSALFSFAGNLIPFPDHNQSPRNIYQCQMGKQTMGIAVHSWKNRADNKMYNLMNPQHPLLKLEAYDKYQMQNYPLGTNACVAVISYTGYDMEDAMVINKSSFERGFTHGMVIKVERINLAETGSFGKSECNFYFSKDPNDTDVKSIGLDGLPIPGRLYRQNDVYYSKKDKHEERYTLGKFKYAEAAYCGIVRAVHNEDEGLVHVLIQWRIPRNPIIGDKFASRHGQKGINSFLWPVESLPFAESGMVPDIIFNPHGFPSRMTIGMMIESMAGKSAAMSGTTYDASPFVFNEQNTAINHFGELLQQAGYNYYGNETMYSGVDGREMEVQIFFGVVYYQRLRHMIADKFQVRSTGVVDPVTLQPVKGRKKGGGIRFGEMERDTMIAHGAAFCLQDRLLYSSDLDFTKVCAKCKSIISVTKLKGGLMNNSDKGYSQKGYDDICLLCHESTHVYNIQVPRVFRYLAAELGSVGIRLHCNVDETTN